MGNGVKLSIEGKGSLPLSIIIKDGVIEYKVANVLYIPKLSNTLISIGEIAKEGYKVMFEGNAMRILLESGDSFKVE